jgi:predicted nucleic acid-binding protein
VAGSVYLADSNILLRLLRRNHAEHQLAYEAVKRLHGSGASLAYTPQNMAEFWNVSTRPKELNGFGLTVEETEMNAQEIERGLTLLADDLSVYETWRRLILRYKVSGVQVHDARLVAAMHVHKISQILTLNTRDFHRYDGIVAVHPNEVLT